MPGAELPGLKRLRPPSSPPSPSSSSPKRALSEDMFQQIPEGASSPAVTAPSGQLGAAATSSALGSSPLRADDDVSVENASRPAAIASEGDSDGGEWVKRTEDVHLGDAATDGVNQYFDHYNQILFDLPPPFEPWQRYYLVPGSLLNQIKTLALGSPRREGSQPAIKLDISPLIVAEGEAAPGPAQDTDAGLAVWKSGDEVHIPDFKVDASGMVSLQLAGLDTRPKERLWAVRPGLVEDEDFKFVSEKTWQALKEWYGPYDGPSLARFCVPPDRIEMMPHVYTLYVVDPKLNSDPAAADTHLPPARITLPTAAPTSMLRLFAGKLYPATDKMTGGRRLWAIDTSLASANNDQATLAAMRQRHVTPAFVSALAGKQLEIATDDTLASHGIEHGDAFVLEYSTASGAWTCQATPAGNAPDIGVSMPPVPQAPPPLFSKPAFFGGSGSSNGSAEASSSKLEVPGLNGIATRSQTRRETKKAKGLVGLQNLGNTCFMNSAVQCLSNTVELNDYFLSGVYRDELNPDNPLGMGGAVAKSFGDVIENLWSNASSYYSPRQLKYVTSRFAPQFAGYGQHDTQEFIAFLLDGLHEDLNRIKQKPYIEKPDWKPGGEAKELAELGKECWDGYRKRNDSVIVDLFQGQLQSTLVCPECHKESITMDPFMYLTVPMPIAQHRRIKLRFVPRDTDKTVKQVVMLVPQNASFGQVKEKLGRLMGCSAEKLVMFDQWKAGVYAWFTDPDHNGEAKDNDDILVHEVGNTVSSTRKSTGYISTDDSITVPVYTFRSLHRHGGPRSDYPSEGSLVPFFITLSKAEAQDPVAVREAITRGYIRLVVERARPHLWVNQGSKQAASALPHFGSDEEGSPVTEVHLDGDHAVSTEGDSRASEGMDVDEASAAPNPPAQDSHVSGAGHVSGAPATTDDGKLVPRGDLFRVHIAEASSAEGNSSLNPFKSKDKVVPFWKGSITSAASSWSLLEHRKKAKRNMLNRLTSGLNSIVSSSYASDDDTASPPATPKEPPLVVRPGEAVFVEWSTKAYAEFFENEYHSTTARFTEEEYFEDPAIAKELAKKKEGKAIGIEDCLDEFSKEETLGQDDLWYCPVCKKHQAATKKLEIYKAPDILVICIKRFGSSRRLSDKLDNLVNFPLEGLDLEDRIGERKVAKTLNLSDEDAAKYDIESMGEEFVYDLYAVDNHFGGLGGGHYTAFCRNRVDNEWYNYDDSRVSRADASSVQSRAAYLLFYRRRAARPIGGLSRIKAQEASRANSRIPSPEPEAGPSRRSSGDSSLLGAPARDQISRDDQLPDYESTAASTASTPASPTISDAEMPAEDSDVEASNRRLGEISHSLGFGNANWTTTSGVTGSPHLGLRHDFATGANTGPSGLATPESLDAVVSTDRPLSPPASDRGD